MKEILEGRWVSRLSACVYLWIIGLPLLDGDSEVGRDLEINGVPSKLFIIRGYTKLAWIIIS
jgi:hypothetical protein